MSLKEIRRFRADILKQPVLLKHIRSLHWSEVVELANAHGYAFSYDESLRYFQDIYAAVLDEQAMTNSEKSAWRITGNPNAMVDSQMPD